MFTLKLNARKLNARKLNARKLNARTYVVPYEKYKLNNSKQ